MWEERLGVKGFNYAHERELKHQYFDFPCCKLGWKELACKELEIWESFRVLHMAIKGLDIEDYFMRRNEDLYIFFITLKDELANEVNPRGNAWSGHILVYK